MKLSKIVLLIMLLHLSAGQAGEKGGNGGYVVACYEDENLKSVELLDLYEGRTSGMVLESYDDLESGIDTISKKIFKPSLTGNKHEEVADLLRDLRRYMKYIPEGTRLLPTNDALPVFKPINCEYEQVANYYNDELIWIDRVLFEKMDVTNQLALLVHEFVYLEERKFGRSDSRYSRRITANALNSIDVFNKTLISEEVRTCQSEDNKTVISFKLLDEDSQLYQLYVERLNGHYIYSDKTMKIEIPFFNQPDLKDDIWMNGGRLVSLIDNNELFTMSYALGVLTASWRGTDPGDKFENIILNCK